MTRGAKCSIFLLILGLFAAGCGGRSPAAEYYVLDSETVAPAAAKSPGNMEVALYKVDIPAYLDRNNIVSRENGSVKLVLPEYHLWAEPLDRGARRIIGETIAPALLDRGAVLLTPNDNQHAARIRVYADIQRLDGELNGEVALTGSFTVRDRDENVLSRGLFSAREQAGQGYAALVAAESRLLVKMGQAMIPHIESALGGKQGARKMNEAPAPGTRARRR